MDRAIHLKDENARTMALNLINNLPMAGSLDLIIRPHKEQRSPNIKGY